MFLSVGLHLIAKIHFLSGPLLLIIKHITGNVILLKAQILSLIWDEFLWPKHYTILYIPSCMETRIKKCGRRELVYDLVQFLISRFQSWEPMRSCDLADLPLSCWTWTSTQIYKCLHKSLCITSHLIILCFSPSSQFLKAFISLSTPMSKYWFKLH